jgi:hypothetical protein
MFVYIIIIIIKKGGGGDCSEKHLPSITSVNNVMAQALSRRPLSTKTRARSQASPCGICGGQSGTRAGFSPSILVFPCQYHSTNNSYLFIHLSLLLNNLGNCRQATNLQNNAISARHKHQSYVIQHLPSWLYYYTVHWTHLYCTYFAMACHINLKSQ